MISKAPLREEFSLTKKKGEVATKLIEQLAELSIFPKLNETLLINALKKEENILTYIKDNSILNNEEDIQKILQAKYQDSKGEATNKDHLNIYKIIFEEETTTNYNTTIFSGGTGSNNITKGFVEKGLKPTLLVNAYDDGKSTGDIRKKFGFLGPSDIAKNIIALIKGKEEIKKFLSYRFSTSDTPETLREQLIDVCFEEQKNTEINLLLQKIEPTTKEQLKKFLKEFNNAISTWEEKHNKTYDLRDYGMRNIIYTGAHLHYGKDYHHTNKELLNLLETKGKIILNNQEPLWLIGITEKGKLLNSEEEVVFDHADEEIARTFLVEKTLNNEQIKQFYNYQTLQERIHYLKTLAQKPTATTQALQTIKETELLIFAPTTFHSSLAPTLYTKGITEALHQSKALKISIANLVRERGHKTVGENLQELERYLNYDLDEGKKTPLDYLIINTHGHRTNGVVKANRIPVDKRFISEQGIELIEVKLADENYNHNQKLIVRILHNLKTLDNLGYCISEGKIKEKKSLDNLKEKKEQLKQALSNPFLYPAKEPLIKRLTCEILKINKLEEYKPLRPIKVVILGAGKATRLNSEIPKIIYPINKKANLAHLLERYKHIDTYPLVAINHHDIPKIEQWSKENPNYNAKMIITKDLRGTAMSFIDILQRELQDFKGDIFLSWGDITNIQKETIQLTCALHHAIGEQAMTMATSWEKNPYAGITRDEEGKVTDVFVTKESPEQKRDYGEHDSSTFIFKTQDMKKILQELIQESGIEKGHLKELNFLYTIPKLVEQGKEVIGIACAHPKESIGYNTKEEVKLVEENMKHLELKEQHKEKLLEDREEEVNEEQFIQHLKRLNNYLEKTYHSLVFDLDDTFIAGGKELSDTLAGILIGLVNEKIPLGIITGRTQQSLNKVFIQKILKHQKLQPHATKYLYLYPENGAYCYRLDEQQKKLYEEKLPYRTVEMIMRILREKVLSINEDYRITNHKIHLWPEDVSKQKEYVNNINKIFEDIKIPLTAYSGSSTKTSDGSIIISKKGINKKTALEHFSKENNLDLNDIVKIGDMAKKGSTDHHLLQGTGSFTVAETDKESKHQVSIPITKGPGYEGIKGTEWLMNKLKFTTKHI